MYMSGYNCPVCKGKRGRQFNHSRCSKIMQEQHQAKRTKKNSNYQFIENRYSKMQSGEVD